MLNIKCKCGSVNLFAEQKGKQTAIYCADCGKWVKWGTKEEIRVLNNRTLQPRCMHVPSQIKTCTIEERLQKFIDFLNNEIDTQLTREKLSTADNIQACCYAHAYEKNKNALINILNGKEWYERD